MTLALSLHHCDNLGRPDRMHLVSRLFFFLLLVLLPPPSHAWYYCRPEDGGGICPDGNHCCPTGIPRVSTCISGHDYQGECCSNQNKNNNNGTLLHLGSTTGCGTGYQCASRHRDNNILVSDHAAVSSYCQRINVSDTDSPARVPPYRLCSLPPAALQKLFGLDVSRTRYATPPKNKTNHENSNSSSSSTQTRQLPDNYYQLAYLTSWGIALDTTDAWERERLSAIETLVVTLHGSNRNADDYLCGTTAAIASSSSSASTTTLVVAPWFATFPDDDTQRRNYSQPDRLLAWAEEGPVLSHTWRYGANAGGESDTSSYAALDALLDFVTGASSSSSSSSSNSNHHHHNNNSSQQQRQQQRFPSLRLIVVTGHSAGGQFTQRWALLSNNVLLQQYDPPATPASRRIPTTTTSATDRHDDGARHGRLGLRHKNDAAAGSSRQNLPSLRVIVADPRCYAYLDDRRVFRNASSHTNNHEDDDNSTFYRRPTPGEEAACPGWNAWEWGLGDDDDNNSTSTTRKNTGDTLLPTPYKDAAVARAGGTDAVVQRYPYRPLRYLQGQLDNLDLHDTCREQMQGRTRLERSRYFAHALAHVYNNHYQPQRWEVVGVPHDHCLIYQSPEGQEALWGE